MSEPLNFRSYLDLLKLAFSKPNAYAAEIPEGGKYLPPIVFFIVNFCVLSLLPLIIDSIIAKNPSLIFIGITGTVFTLPLGVLALFIFSGIFFIIAKLIGAKGSYKSAFNCLSYAMLPLIFSWIPFIAFIFYALAIYILILAFARLERFSIVKAGVTILAPILIITVLLVATGILGLPNGKIF
jgi:hypothetical protein